MPLERLKQRLRDRMTANAVNAASGVQDFQDTLLEVVLEVIDEFRSERLQDQEERASLMDAVSALAGQHATLISEVRAVRSELRAFTEGLKLEQARGDG